MNKNRNKMWALLCFSPCVCISIFGFPIKYIVPHHHLQGRIERVSLMRILKCKTKVRDECTFCPFDDLSALRRTVLFIIAIQQLKHM